MTAGGRASSLDRLAAELEEPLARVGGERWKADSAWCAARLSVLLARAELRAWRVEVVERAGLVLASCPLGSGQASIAWSRPPVGELAVAAFIVARSAPVAPGRWILLGRASIVGVAAAGEYERLLHSLRAPRGEFWRVHGAVLARAARVAREAGVEGVTHGAGSARAGRGAAPVTERRAA